MVSSKKGMKKQGKLQLHDMVILHDILLLCLFSGKDLAPYRFMVTKEKVKIIDNKR